MAASVAQQGLATHYAPPHSTLVLRYSETSPIQVRGAVTGRTYQFSGAQPLGSVDARDAAAMLRTRFFRRA